MITMIRVEELHLSLSEMINLKATVENSSNVGTNDQEFSHRMYMKHKGGKGEIACHMHLLLFPSCFHKIYFVDI